MKNIKYIFLIIAIVFALAGCESYSDDAVVNITQGDFIELSVGESCQLTLDGDYTSVQWISTDSSVEVSDDGKVTAIHAGEARVRAIVFIGESKSDFITVRVINNVVGGDGTDITVDPYENMSAEEFYAGYTPAKSYLDAYYRSKHGFMSGSLDIPSQMHTAAQNRPKCDGKFIKNTTAAYTDSGNTYIVYDSFGNEKMRIYKGGAYITLEEVAAYMYAFGGSSAALPANYISKSSGKPSSSIWGKYLRLNHSYFSGSIEEYPYEPALPNIRGNGGSLQYYEMDIGTTGTVTPTRVSGAYNNGSKIIRGAARLVYARADLNGNGAFDNGEIYVFYTYNHYNDFVEYLNYYGGWGEVFGNVTGGGTFDSKTDCSPTSYPAVHYADITASTTLICPNLRKYGCLAA